jgi:uncharacterized membrane protein YqjE
MADPPVGGVADLADDLRRSWSDLGEMLALRRELAELELRSDLNRARRFGIFGGVALSLAIAGVAVVAAAVANHFDALFAHAFPWITVATGAVLLVGGSLAAAVAWYRFRSRLLLFEQSRAELAEDLLWLEEWLGGERR